MHNRKTMAILGITLFVLTEPLEVAAELIPGNERVPAEADDHNSQRPGEAGDGDGFAAGASVS